MIAVNDASTKVEKRIFGAVSALCLVGFPLILVVVDATDIHPGLGRGTGADQIRTLASASEDWAAVHGLFVVAGFLALATMLVLRRLVAAGDPTLAPDVAAAIGVVGAVVFIATVLMEVIVIPDLSEACAATRACLSAANEGFTEAFADQGWRVLPGLSWGARGIALGLVLLGVLGAKVKSLTLWESGLLSAGGLYEFYVGTGLHGWGTFSPELALTGLAGLAVLGALSSVAARLVRDGSGSGTLPQPAAEQVS